MTHGAVADLPVRISTGAVTAGAAALTVLGGAALADEAGSADAGAAAAVALGVGTGRASAPERVAFGRARGAEGVALVAEAAGGGA